MSAIAFIDLEASGLGPASWPIEVGWCFVEGAPSTFLIKPDAGWSDEAWEPAAEALHGVARTNLDVDGVATGEICTALNAALKDAVVYSDAPDWDGFWLYRLFAAAKMRQRFELRDFAELFAAILPAEFEAAKVAASDLAPHRHRAAADVLHMRALFAAAQAGPPPSGL
ncbi:MAG: hypothetical protein AAFW81_08630 [Pseudomonadota bacterium]